MATNRYNRYRNKTVSKTMNNQEAVIYHPDKLYERIKMRTYDVIMMTEDQFLRISQFKNWGLIKVIDDSDYVYNLAHTIKYYNTDLYEKFKLLFTEFEVSEPSEKEMDEKKLIQEEIKRFLSSMMNADSQIFESLK